MSTPQSLANGRYLLVEKLGEGGMATVFRAFDQRLQVWRAIKVLAPQFTARPSLVQRFEVEAQTMALLEHPNIVRVYDVGRDGGCAYIVMELVNGGCLVDWLREYGPMPSTLAVQVTIDVCRGLGAAHNKGVIHRDIKPHNVMVTGEGVCRVTDFGIARVGDAQSQLTKTGATMGTWGYMAPEQRTDAKTVDVRADVYSLGALLYSLLTDKIPMDLFAADRDETMLEGIPPEMVPLLVKSTEYHRDKRFADVDEMADALRDLLGELPPLDPDVPGLALPADRGVDPPSDEAFATAVPLTESWFGGASGTLMPAESGGTSVMDASEPDGLHAPTGVLVESAVTLPPTAGAVLHYVGGQHDDVYLPGEEGEEPAMTAVKAATIALMMFALVAFFVLIGLMAWQALYPRQRGVAQPTPVPVVQPLVVPAPVDPAPTPPSVPKPDPQTQPATHPRPVTQPQSVTQPESVTQLESVTQPQPSVVIRPAAGQCLEVKAPGASKVGDKAIFVADLCVEDGTEVLLHYRSAPKGAWRSKMMPVINGSHRARVDVKEEFSDGLEYYVEAGEHRHGSSGTPKSMGVN